MLNAFKYLMYNIFFAKKFSVGREFSLTNAKYYTTKNVLFIHSHQPDNLYYPFNLF